MNTRDTLNLLQQSQQTLAEIGERLLRLEPAVRSQIGGKFLRLAKKQRELEARMQQAQAQSNDGLGFVWWAAAGGVALLSALGLDIFRHKQKVDEQRAILDCFKWLMAENPTMTAEKAARICGGSSIGDLINDLKPLLALAGAGVGLYFLFRKDGKE